MNKKRFIYLLLLSKLLLLSCGNNDNEYDASGTFEATETIVSAEANGKILALNMNEGDLLKIGQQIGYIDSTQLYLSKLQLLKNQKAVLSGRPEIDPQLKALESEKASAVSDKKRIEILVQGNVASQKQLDDAQMRIAVLQSKIEATKSSLSTTTSALNDQGATVGAQLDLLQDQLRKCKIINPIDGTVLTKYTAVYEMAIMGKPLYKIANLSTMILRVYVTADQLSQLKINQTVKVFVDFGKDKTKEYSGRITWISDQSEFTPKTIQTKDERANSVYAIKITIPNDGYLKIGMYGGIKI